MHKPDVLILDEPTSGLDPSGRKQVRDLMLSLKAAGKAIFLSSHLLSEVEQICGGKPARPKLGDRPVAVVKWVDGTVLDTVWQVG